MARADQFKDRQASNQKGAMSLPSRLVYSVDVPEIKNLNSSFVYNFYVLNESVKDSNTLDDPAVEKMNISQDIRYKKSYDYTEANLLNNRSKIPRYVKLQYNIPNSEKVTLATSTPKNFITQNINFIVKEESFASSYYTSLNFNNANLDKQTSIMFESGATYENQINVIGEADQKISDSIANQPTINKNAVYFKPGQGKLKGNSYLESLKKLNTSTQISNNIVHDLFVTSAGNPLTINSDSFDSLTKGSSNAQGNNNLQISEDEFKTSVEYYAILSDADNHGTEAKHQIMGYIIDKVEIFPDGSKKVHDPIIVENARSNMVIDTNVRYGTVYSYSIRTVMEVVYAAVNNLTYDTSMISSLVASRPVTTIVETLENIGPPPPVELKANWDYDRINPLTTLYDYATKSSYANTGKNGSLFLHWSFPINSQMDIKKFQVFRRKSVEEPFELIKMYDFDDAMLKFPILEENIKLSLVEVTTPDPKKSYYDDEFMKNSEFIYAVAAIDAHGLTSNYSEQIKVSFDVYKNILNTKIISLAGAPKQYPNLYLKEDLFIDSIKTSNKKTLNLYFTPDCYKASLTNNSVKNLVKTSGTSYKINFINLDNQDSSQLEIKLEGNT